MDEVLSVKFIKEENNVDRDSLRVEGEFMSRIIFSNRDRTELKLISMRHCNEITIKGSFSGAYGDSLWVQNEHTDLIEYKYKEGLLKKEKRVEVNDTARVLLGKVFIQKNGRLSVHDLLMNEVFSMRSNACVLSETHFLVKRDHEVILYTVEGLTEVRRVPVKDKYEVFLVGESILIITESILKIVKDTEITVNLSIDIDEDMDEDVDDMIRNEGDSINNGYIIKACKNIGPIECMLIIGHRQSVDIEYIIVNESTAQKYQLEEESDGLSVPLMHSLINMYVLESTVLESINQEDKEIIQGPTIAVETNLNVYLYGMVLDVSDPSKYISTRRSKEDKIELDVPIITYKDSAQPPEDSHSERISGPSEDEESSTSTCTATNSEEEEHTPSDITDKEAEYKKSTSGSITTHNKEEESSFSTTETGTNKSVSPLTLLSLSNLVPHTSSDNKVSESSTNLFSKAVNESVTEPVKDNSVSESSNSLFSKAVDDSVSNKSSNSLFSKPVTESVSDNKPMTNLFSKPVTEPVSNNKPMSESMTESSTNLFSKPMTESSNSLFSKPVDNSNKSVSDNESMTNSVSHSVSDNEPMTESMTNSVTDKSNNPTEEDFLNYSLKNLNIKNESSAKKRVLLGIPVRNSPMNKIEDMISGLDNSFKNPIVSVKNDIQEIREVSSRCKSILESIEVFDISDKEVSVKDILSGVEEAIILVKDQLSHLTQEVEDRNLVQEKVSALLVLVQCRLNKMEEVISTSPPDYSKEIEYVNTRISKIFNISTYTTGKSEDQVSPNSISIYSKPLELATDQVHKIEESIILPATRESTLSMLTECFKKLRINPAHVSSSQDISLIDRIFSTEAEQTFLKTIQTRGNNSVESVNPIPLTDLSQASTQSVSNTPQKSTSTLNQTNQASQTNQTSTPSVSIFSQTSQTSQASQTSTPRGSLFSQSVQSNMGSTPSGSLFSQTSQPSQTNQPGSLFGQTSTPSGSIFGQSNQSSQSTPNQASQTGSIFGQPNQTSQASQTGSLFSQPAQSNQFNQSGSLFSQPAQSNQSNQSGSIFSQPSQSNQSTQPSGSIFGQSNQPNQPTPNQPSSSLFGQSNQPNQPGSIFSQPSQSTSGGFNSGIFSQQSNPSFNLLQRQSNPFTQGNSKLGLGSSSNTSSLFKKPPQEQ
ncbi:hypothetical protein NEPAR06_2063 [Nematocida parisii]|nr:hypothetical protein NEPAR06_2063 [Nematocida parisii]KAI5156651.1 hypothetical protein NEPAR05_0718 [Nematocida parisii]